MLNHRSWGKCGLWDFRRLFLAGCLWTVFLFDTSCRPFHPNFSELIIPQPFGTPLSFPVAGVDLMVEARDSLDENLETFDCDLLRVNVHPIWVQIRNRGAITLDFGRARFQLEETGGRTVRFLTAAELVERLYVAYSIRSYVPFFRQGLESEFARMSLQLGALTPGGQAAGYLFVHLADRRPHALAGSTLQWSNIWESGNPRPHVFLHTFH